MRSITETNQNIRILCLIILVIISFISVNKINPIPIISIFLILVVLFRPKWFYELVLKIYNKK